MIGAVVSDAVNAIAIKFKSQTGKTLVIVSGMRSPAKQAAAMYTKFALGDEGSGYSNKEALAKIIAAYVANDDYPDKAQKAMEQVIAEQVKKGDLISRHLTGKAIDVRNRDLSDADVQALKEIVETYNGTATEEEKPPHIHIQFR